MLLTIIILCISSIKLKVQIAYTADFLVNWPHLVKALRFYIKSHELGTLINGDLFLSMLPSPRTCIVAPSWTPGGTTTLILRFDCTWPRPPHFRQWSVIIFPLPPHFKHVDTWKHESASRKPAKKDQQTKIVDSSKLFKITHRLDVQRELLFCA